MKYLLAILLVMLPSLCMAKPITIPDDKRIKDAYYHGETIKWGDYALCDSCRFEATKLILNSKNHGLFSGAQFDKDSVIVIDGKEYNDPDKLVEILTTLGKAGNFTFPGSVFIFKMAMVSTDPRGMPIKFKAKEMRK